MYDLEHGSWELGRDGRYRDLIAMIKQENITVGKKIQICEIINIREIITFHYGHVPVSFISISGEILEVLRI